MLRSRQPTSSSLSATQTLWVSLEFSVPIVCVMTAGQQRDQARQLIREMASGLGISIPLADLDIDGRSLDDALRRGSAPRARRGILGRPKTTAQLLELVA